MGMRVAVLNRLCVPRELQDYEDGGGTNVAMIAKGLSNEGAKVDIFTTAHAGYVDQMLPPNVRLHRLCPTPSYKSSVFERYYESGCAFGAAVLGHPFALHDYDIVHVHHWSSCLGDLATVVSPARLVYTPHLCSAMKAQALQTNLPAEVLINETRLMQQARFIIALSRSERQFILEHYAIGPSEKVRIIPNGVHKNFFRRVALPEKEWMDRCNQPRLITVGRLCPQKAQDITLTAIAAVRRKCVGLQASIIGGTAGDAEFEALLERMTSTLGLRDAVEFTGILYQDTLVPLLHGGTLFLQPSRCETQAIALLESMGAGLPVVASAIPVHAEHVVSGTNGLLFSLNQPDALAEAICALLEDPNLCNRAAVQNSEYASGFRWDECVETSLRLLTAVTEMRR